MKYAREILFKNRRISFAPDRKSLQFFPEREKNHLTPYDHRSKNKNNRVYRRLWNTLVKFKNVKFLPSLSLNFLKRKKKKKNQRPWNINRRLEINFRINAYRRRKCRIRENRETVFEKIFLKKHRPPLQSLIEDLKLIVESTCMETWNTLVSFMKYRFSKDFLKGEKKVKRSEREKKKERKKKIEIIEA